MLLGEILHASQPACAAGQLGPNCMHEHLTAPHANQGIPQRKMCDHSASGCLCGTLLAAARGSLVRKLAGGGAGHYEIGMYTLSASETHVQILLTLIMQGARTAIVAGEQASSWAICLQLADPYASQGKPTP